MAVINYLDIVLGAKTQQLDKGMDAGKVKVSSFARQVSGGAGGALAGLGPMAVVAGAAIGTALVAGAQAATAAVGNAVQGIRDALGSIDEATDAADRANVSFGELAKFRFAALEGSNLGPEAADKALVKMQLNLQKAKQDGGLLANQLAAVGLDSGKLLEAGPVSAFKQLAAATQSMRDPTQQMQLAFNLFGREGAALVSTLREGPAAIEESMIAAEQLGLALSDAQASQVASANDAWGRVQALVQGVFQQLATAVAPVIEVIAREVTAWATSFGGMSTILPTITDYLALGAGFIVDAAKFAWNYYDALYRIVTLDFDGAKAAFSGMGAALNATNAKRFVEQVRASRKEAERSATEQKPGGLIDVDAIMAAEEAKQEAAKEAAKAADRAKEQAALQSKRRELDRLRKMEDEAEKVKGAKRISEQSSFGALERGSVAAQQAASKNSENARAAKLQEKANAHLASIQSHIEKVANRLGKLEAVGALG